MLSNGRTTGAAAQLAPAFPRNSIFCAMAIEACYPEFLRLELPSRHSIPFLTLSGVCHIAFMPFTEEEVSTKIESLAPDLKFLLEDRNVDKTIMAQLADAGFTSMNIFSMLGDSRMEVREVLVDEPFNLGLAVADLQPGEKVRRRAKQAMVLDAWEAAKHRMEERAKKEAAQRAAGGEVKFHPGDHIALRKAFESLHGRIEKECYPAEALIETRYKEAENCTLKADSLKDIISQRHEEDAPEEPKKKGNVRRPMPTTTEELRAVLALLGRSYALAKLKHPGLKWMVDLTPDTWTDHANYLLGDRVHGFKLESAPGVIVKPSWDKVLAYEHHLREEAIRLVLYENFSFGAAMVAARKSTELRERYFTTPVLAQAVTPPPAPPPVPYHAVRSAPRGDRPVQHKGSGPYGGKGDGKKGGKGKKGQAEEWANFTKDSMAAPVWERKTPDGKPICFKYNLPWERCDGYCGMEHVCRICFATDHPVHAHRNSRHGYGPSSSGGGSGRSY